MGDMSPCKHGGSVGYCSICNPELEELTNELATLREQVVSQQARIAQMRTALNEYVDVIISYNDPETWQPTCRDNGHHARIALATHDDLSALKAHDDALWSARQGKAQSKKSPDSNRTYERLRSITINIAIRH